MLIEVLGPSGVGKTSILSGIQEKWHGKILFPNQLQSAVENQASPVGLKAVTMELLDDQEQTFAPYVETVFRILAGSHTGPYQKMGAMNVVFKACQRYAQLQLLDDRYPYILHDELLLHRADSILPFSDDVKRDAEKFFCSVPEPRPGGHAVIYVLTPPEDLFQRIKARNVDVNCYRGMDDGRLKAAVGKLLEAAQIGIPILRNKDYQVEVLDTAGQTIEQSCSKMDALLRRLCPTPEASFQEQAGSPPRVCLAAELKRSALLASGSFRRKDGRWNLKTKDVFYCAFATKNFTVERDEAQRDAARRLERFGLDRRTLQGKTLLDLGCNIGAMLFQAANYGIAQGVGIEFDDDKVQCARQIAKISEIQNLTFCQGDIERLDATKLGRFDYVFALAVEGHLNQPERLYPLLSAVTKNVLFFEGNGSSNINQVKKGLSAAGFKMIQYLGLCDDDRVPSNNRRPLLRAYKNLITLSGGQVSGAGGITPYVKRGVAYVTLGLPSGRAPKRGDFAVWRETLPSVPGGNYRLSFRLRNTYHKEVYEGRNSIRYSVVLGGKELFSRFVTDPEYTDVISASCTAENEEIELLLRVECLKNEKPWKWEYASRTTLSAVFWEREPD